MFTTASAVDLCGNETSNNVKDQNWPWSLVILHPVCSGLQLLFIASLSLSESYQFFIASMAC